MSTCVLFGAGAERDFGLSIGKDFAKNVTGIYSEYDKDIKEFYNKLNDDWFPKYRKKGWDEKDLLKAAVRKKWMLNGIELTSKKEYEELVNQEVENMNQNTKNQMLEKYTSYMGILDESFFTIIQPKQLGPYKFWSIVCCYWRAYLCLVKSMCKDKGNLWLMEHPKEAYRLMCEYAKSYKEVDSYYRVIKNIDSEVSVITTNYTPFCEIITGLSKDKIAYIHGKFNWMEFPKELCVVDVVDETIEHSRYDYFPYIFLQSGVKPIVEGKQLKEYKKAIEQLDNSNRIIICGFSMSCDDNHIVALIREQLMRGKEIVYLNYEDIYSEEELLRIFRINNKKDNLKIVQCRKDDSIRIFEKYIEVC